MAFCVIVDVVGAALRRRVGERRFYCDVSARRQLAARALAAHEADANALGAVVPAVVVARNELAGRCRVAAHVAALERAELGARAVDTDALDAPLEEEKRVLDRVLLAVQFDVLARLKVSAASMRGWAARQ